MDARTLLAVTLLAVTVPGIAAAADPPAARNSTAAEENARQGSGTAANAATAPAGDAGGTTIGSGADTGGTSGLAVEQGTVMRPLSAKGRNAPRKEEPARRTQLYGLNPKADDPLPEPRTGERGSPTR